MSSLLGIPDGEIVHGERVSWDTNKIGGEPDWVIEGNELPICAVCSVRMKLVVQVYCPLQDSPYHRVLYISTCSTKSCWNKPHSWKVQRCQILDQNSSHNVADSGTNSQDGWGVEEDDWGDTVTMETKDWCDGADDWGDEDTSVAMTMEQSSQNANLNNSSASNSTNVESLQFKQMNIADESFDTDSNHSDSSDQTSNIVQSEAAEINQDLINSVIGLLATRNKSVLDNSNKDPVMDDSACMRTPVTSQPFAAYYLSVVNESDYKCDDQQIEHLVKNYEKESGADLKTLFKSKCDMKGLNGGIEEYEKSDVKGDKFSHRFIKRLKKCPQQCIRYEWNSDPIFISQPSKDNDIKGMLCSNCRSSCVFELQLMPPLINFLHNQNGDTCEFGTVLIYTCKNSCWSSENMSLLENCLVQCDPDSHLFK